MQDSSSWTMREKGAEFYKLLPSSKANYHAAATLAYFVVLYELCWPYRDACKALHASRKLQQNKSAPQYQAFKSSYALEALEANSVPGRKKLVKFSPFPLICL